MTLSEYFFNKTSSKARLDRFLELGQKKINNTYLKYRYGGAALGTLGGAAIGGTTGAIVSKKGEKLEGAANGVALGGFIGRHVGHSAGHRLGIRKSDAIADKVNSRIGSYAGKFKAGKIKAYQPQSPANKFWSKIPNEKDRERAKKFSRLAKGGVGGEKSNAEAFARAAANKHGVDYEDMLKHSSIFSNLACIIRDQF